MHEYGGVHPTQRPPYSVYFKNLSEKKIFLCVFTEAVLN